MNNKAIIDVTTERGFPLSWDNAFALAEGIASALDVPIAAKDEDRDVIDAHIRINDTTTGAGFDFFFKPDKAPAKLCSTCNGQKFVVVKHTYDDDYDSKPCWRCGDSSAPIIGSAQAPTIENTKGLDDEHRLV